ncbi:MAG: DUF3352 domain-containing protein [Rikenellaceae bacterium]|nr:DUF3352 domain-containing protein [Rikenellaceae bacterium]
MEEPLPTPLIESAAPLPPKKRGKAAKRILFVVLAVAAAYGLWSAYDVFLTPDRNIRQIYLVPRDAAVIIQTDDPVGDWKRFSASEPWQALKGAPSFAEISKSVDRLDSIVKANNTLLSLAGQRQMIISLHKTRSNGWDFLIAVDLQKASKMNTLKENIEQIFKLNGYDVTNRKYRDVTITESRDPKTLDILHTAFIENHFLASYDPRLIEASIDERKQPAIGLNRSFLEVEKLVMGKGLSRIYLNYDHLPQYLSLYLGRNEYVDMLCRSMDFGGVYLLSDRERMEVAGTMILREDPDPYVSALLHSGRHKMSAHELMSARTAFYANVGFDNTVTFVDELEKALVAHDPAAFNTYRSARSKLEKYFDISLEENFLNWMDGEFALSQSEPGLLGREPEQILAIRTKNIKEARKQMDLLEKRINRRSPINVKTIAYKGFEVKYIEMGGFFRIFFGKLFDKFEKPYYTYIGDYVVFSNRAASLLSFIEDYERQNLLSESEGFRTAYARVNNTSTIFTYVDMPKFFAQLKPLLSSRSWADLQGNREVLFSLPQWTLQVAAERGSASLQLVLNHAPYRVPAPAEQLVADESIVLPDEDLSEKELMSELERFYVEHFEGNVLHEYYPDGSLQSESEIKNGRRNGRYREFFENGKLKVRGAYTNNVPRGTWKYYTEEGEFDHKEKH